MKNKNLIKNSRHKLYILQWSGRFITCMGVLFLTVELDNLIQLSTFSRMSGCQDGIIPNEPAGLVNSFIMSGPEVLACSYDSNLNYVMTMLQLHLVLNH